MSSSDADLSLNSATSIDLSINGTNKISIDSDSIDLLADADEINVNGQPLSDLIGSGYTISVHTITRTFERGKNKFYEDIDQIKNGGFVIFAPIDSYNLFYEDINLKITQDSSIGHRFVFDYMYYAGMTESIEQNILEVIGVKENNSDIHYINVFPISKRQLLEANNNFTGNNTFDTGTTTINNKLDVNGTLTLQGELTAPVIKAYYSLTKNGKDVLTEDGLSSYATKTYVAEQIQTAIGDAWEGEY